MYEIGFLRSMSSATSLKRYAESGITSADRWSSSCSCNAGVMRALMTTLLFSLRMSRKILPASNNGEVNHSAQPGEEEAGDAMEGEIHAAFISCAFSFPLVRRSIWIWRSSGIPTMRHSLIEGGLMPIARAASA